MIGAIDRKKLRNIFNLPPELKILLVLAIGKPKEEAVIENVGPDGNIRYWQDDKNIHHVPKRSLKDIIVA